MTDTAFLFENISPSGLHYITTGRKNEHPQAKPKLQIGRSPPLCCVSKFNPLLKEHKDHPFLLVCQRAVGIKLTLIYLQPFQAEK